MHNTIVVISPGKFSGEITAPADKSISHRAVIIGSLAQGKTEIDNFLSAEDCLATVACMRSLGVVITERGRSIGIRGKGMRLQPSCRPLYAGNSGTTARLLTGVLAGQPFTTGLAGDESLGRRPMLRVVEPLRHMGALIGGGEDGNKLPLTISGGDLKPLYFDMPVASAQVKSAVLLAGLFAHGETTISESKTSRDHTERMLETFGADITRNENVITVKGPANLKGCNIKIPGDISSAAFLMVASSIIPGSELMIKEVGINPTRTGVIDVLNMMGADLTVLNRRNYGNEPVGDIRIKGTGSLNGITIGGEIIPRVIDEIPVLAVAAAMAQGTTVIKDAGELRVKESDRLKMLSGELSRMGALIQEKPDGLIIEGGKTLKGCMCESHGDHRLAMAMAIAGLVASGETVVKGAECIAISYPSFMEDLKTLSG